MTVITMLFLPILLASAILTNMAEVAAHMRARRPDARAEVEAVVTFLEDKGDNSHLLGLKDAAGESVAWLSRRVFDIDRPQLGDRVRVCGDVVLTRPYLNMVFICSDLSVLAHGPVPPPRAAPARDILSGVCIDQTVAVRGTVVDSFRDEIDTHVYFIILDCGRESVYVCVISSNDLSDRLHALDGAEVEVTGICTTGGGGQRRLAGSIVNAVNPTNIRVIRSPDDRFDAPELRPGNLVSPADVMRLGRRRVRGTVAAAWLPNHALMHLADGLAVTLELSGSQPLPACGQAVEAVGFTETDLYHVNLSHVLWRATTNGASVAAERPTRVSPRDLLTDGKGHFLVNPLFHGKPVTLSGTVKDPAANGRFSLVNDGISLKVDASALPSALDDLAPGCQVSVTGICVLDVETWKPYGAFPHAKGYTLVLRRPDDLVLLAAPPWWTVDRLLVALGVLFAALLGIFIWNRMLSRLVDRRSRQLAKEELAHARADLRSEERTLLSVELHDTIAQNLTGVALQLDSVELAAAQDPNSISRYVENTRQSLKNCRENLRNCLWDLCNCAFESESLDEAIAKTVAPHKKQAEIVLNCPIRTQNLPDSTIHAILCIVRELVINAVRHGAATTIRIDATKERGHLALTVRDNGSGFDPDTAPGLAEGHFGLQGVRERVHRLGGSLTISSAPQAGTEVRIKNLVITDLK